VCRAAGRDAAGAVERSSAVIAVVVSDTGLLRLQLRRHPRQRVVRATCTLI